MNYIHLTVQICTAVCLIVFGTTFLVITRKVKTYDYDLVKNILKFDESGWWHRSEFSFTKLSSMYKVYIHINGLNAVFILNILSFFLYLAWGIFLFF